jgi:hypothetical protein
MRVGLEIGIDEVRDFSGMPVQLDEVGSVEFAEVGTGASFVDRLQWARRLERAAVDMSSTHPNLADLLTIMPLAQLSGLGFRVAFPSHRSADSL